MESEKLLLSKISDDFAARVVEQDNLLLLKKFCEMRKKIKDIDEELIETYENTAVLGKSLHPYSLWPIT